MTYPRLPGTYDNFKFPKYIYIYTLPNSDTGEQGVKFDSPVYAEFKPKDDNSFSRKLTRLRFNYQHPRQNKI